MVLNCSEITLLMEKQKTERLSLITSLRFKSHIIICKWCRAYKKKFARLDELMSSEHSRSIQHKVSDDDLTLFKHKMKEKFK